MQFSPPPLSQFMSIISGLPCMYTMLPKLSQQPLLSSLYFMQLSFEDWGVGCVCMYLQVGGIWYFWCYYLVLKGYKPLSPAFWLQLLFTQPKYCQPSINTAVSHSACHLPRPTGPSHQSYFPVSIAARGAAFQQEKSPFILVESHEASVCPLHLSVQVPLIGSAILRLPSV